MMNVAQFFKDTLLAILAGVIGAVMVLGYQDVKVGKGDYLWCSAFIIIVFYVVRWFFKLLFDNSK
jgi:hypothetical protein